MSNSDLARAFELIARMPDADFDGPKSEALITSAERSLGLSFPPTYRMFLNRLGCGGIIGYEFFGIIDDNFTDSAVPDAIWLTLKNRKSSGLPDSFVVIGDTGNGGYYVIDVSEQTTTGECPVLLWCPFDEPSVRRLVAEDFGDYLLQRVEWAQQQADATRE